MYINIEFICISSISVVTFYMAIWEHVESGMSYLDEDLLAGARPVCLLLKVSLMSEVRERERERD